MVFLYSIIEIISTKVVFLCIFHEHLIWRASIFWILAASFLQQAFLNLKFYSLKRCPRQQNWTPATYIVTQFGICSSWVFLPSQSNRSVLKITLFSLMVLIARAFLSVGHLKYPEYSRKVYIPRIFLEDNNCIVIFFWIKYWIWSKSSWNNYIFAKEWQSQQWWVGCTLVIKISFVHHKPVVLRIHQVFTYET